MWIAANENDMSYGKCPCSAIDRRVFFWPRDAYRLLVGAGSTISLSKHFVYCRTMVRWLLLQSDIIAGIHFAKRFRHLSCRANLAGMPIAKRFSLTCIFSLACISQRFSLACVAHMNPSLFRFKLQANFCQANYAGIYA